MATLVSYRENRAWGPMVEEMEFVYDFAKDGGATGALDVVKVKDACVLRNAYYKVNTACTSGGSATVSLGKSGDAAGIVAATAVASLTAGAVIDSASIGTGYKLAADDVVQLSIGTAALTAGKITVVIELAKF